MDADIEKALQKVTKDNPVACHNQIEQIISQAIERHVLAPGTRLPSERELAQLCKVSRSTVRLSLDRLVHQGHVEKFPGKGIFVASPAVAKAIGCAFPPQNSDTRYQWPVVLSQALVREVGRRGYEEFTYLLESNADYGRMERDIQDGRIQGMLAMGVLGPFEEQVPIVHTSLESEGNKVYIDYHSLVYQGVEFLAGQGRSRIALARYTGDSRVNRECMRAYREALQDRNLAFREEWVVGIEGAEEGGDRALRQLWALEDRLDGILFVDDFQGLGGTRALVDLGVQVPEEVMVVTHMNKGYTLPYPVSVAGLQVDPQLIAREMVNMLELIWRGERPPRRTVMVEPRLITSQ